MEKVTIAATVVSLSQHVANYVGETYVSVVASTPARAFFLELPGQCELRIGDKILITVERVEQ